jgi:2-dehydro-3-deoxygalactonokinase
MQKFFLSCDWGTSAFRLRLVDEGNLDVIDQVVSKDGISTTHDQWKKQNALDDCPREAFYLNKLQRQAEELERKTGRSLAGTPLIISGMASSSIGIRELPYASLPFCLGGGDAIAQPLQSGSEFWDRVILISGVSTERDVMRGEETQMVGISALYPAGAGEEVICIFPGTHSKHLKMKEGKLTDLRTYVTGELFDLMANQSILKEAVSASTRPMDKDDVTAFGRGIDQSREFNLLNSLFSVRVNQLFKSLNKEQNFYFLSGLLIGSELMDLRGKQDLRIQVCSGSNLYELYRLGIEKSGLAENTSFISPEIMDRSVIKGQWKIAERIKDQ